MFNSYVFPVSDRMLTQVTQCKKKKGFDALTVNTTFFVTGQYTVIFNKLR